jgi:hypothetical protein
MNENVEGSGFNMRTMKSFRDEFGGSTNPAMLWGAESSSYGGLL